jgi:hypothetical protein
MSRHFGTYHLDRAELAMLARSFMEGALWLLGGLRSAHGKIPMVETVLIDSAMENFDSAEKIFQRYDMLRFREDWIRSFIADCDRFHICGVFLLTSSEASPAGCKYGVGILLALAEAFLLSAEKEKSEAVNHQMHEMAPDFAGFFDGELAGILDSFGKKEKEG